MTSNTQQQTDVIDRARFRRILFFFGGIIANVIWWDLLVGRIFKAKVRRSRPERFRRMSRQFRELAIEMGGVMIKLGQFLSARVDILPPEITEELAGLQDEVPAVPFSDIELVLSAELGNVSAHFSEIDSQPLAAASLGQAHHARLAPGNERVPNSNTDSVVVKVQRPGIEDVVRTDLAALRVVSRWVMRYRPIRRRADVPALLKEFSTTLWEELDYESEADNAERFATMFSGNDEIRIPAILREHSTRRVLVLEDVGGIKITDIEAMTAAGIKRSDVAARVLDAYFFQIFKEGFFHADPHPGNLFVQPIEPVGYWPEDKSIPFRLTFVDFGMVGHIEDLMGDNLRRVLVSITKRDARELTEAFNDLGFFLPGSDLDRISEAQATVLDHLWGRNLLELSQPDPEEIQELTREFRDILFEFPFQVPQDFIFLGRALGMLSGLTSLLDPNINPWNLVEQYGSEIIRSRDGVEFTLSTIADWARIFIGLPWRIDKVLSSAESGKLRFKNTSDTAILRKLDRIERRLNRPNWSLIAAVLFLSGTLFYVNGDTEIGAVFWGLAGLILFGQLIFRG